jgi:quercetin 2,3-dioxygenase
MEGFQLWVNLPVNLKMSKPRYQEIKSPNIPEILTNDGVFN